MKRGKTNYETLVFLLHALLSLGLGDDPPPWVEPLLEGDHHHQVDDGSCDDGKRKTPGDGGKPLHSLVLLFEGLPTCLWVTQRILPDVGIFRCKKGTNQISSTFEGFTCHPKWDDHQDVGDELHTVRL